MLGSLPGLALEDNLKIKSCRSVLEKNLMQSRSIAFVAAALLLSLAIPLKSFAEDDAKMSAA
jgi:hypothetical protein